MDEKVYHCSGDYRRMSGERVIGKVGRWTLVCLASNRTILIHGNDLGNCNGYSACPECGEAVPKALVFLSLMESS